jgi:hypothetical protein
MWINWFQICFKLACEFSLCRYTTGVAAAATLALVLPPLLAPLLGPLLAPGSPLVAAGHPLAGWGWGHPLAKLNWVWPATPRHTYRHTCPQITL